MARLSLSLATLGDLDGGAGALLANAEIERAVADLYDRAEEDGKPRKVAIELELAIKDGIVVVNLRAQAKLPPRQTKGTVAGVQHREGKPVMIFQSMSPENVSQDNFAELDEG